MPPQSRVVGRVSVRVMPDTSRFRADLTKSLERLERTLSVQIPTKLDSQQVQRDAVAARRQIERQLSDVKTTLDIGASRAQLQQTNRQLDALARQRTAEINVDVDRASLARAARALGRIGGTAVGGSAAVGGISVLGASAAVSAGQIVELAAALAPAAGALAALPAVAASAGAALATLQVATAGVGEAMGAALTGDATELAEALEGLAPAAQSVVREVSTLRPEVDALRESVQQEFFAPLVGQMEEVGSRLLPVLTEGMSELSGAMGEAAGETLAFAGSAQALAFLDDLFSSTATAVGNAEGAVADLLSGLTELGTVGLPFVEDLGAAIGDAAERFNDWATEAAESGQATEWIQGAIDLFSQLGRIASNVGGIFSSVFSAAGEGGILTTIENLTGALDDFFASAEGGQALEGLFEGLASVGSALSPVIASLASGIGALAPAIGRIAEAFGPVLTSAIDGLVPALLELEPGITAVIGALGEGVDALVESGALEDLGSALSDILTALAPILPVMGELAALLIGALAEALIAIAPSLALVAEKLADELGPVLPELAESFGDLVEALAPLIPPLVEAMLPVLELLPDLITLIAENMDTWTGVIEELAPFIPIFAGALSHMTRILVMLISWVIRAANWFQNLKQSGQDARDTMVSAAGQIRARVVGGLRRMMAFIRSIPTRIRNVFTGARRMLRSAGRDIVQGLINGIRSMVGSVGSAMSNVASRIRGYLPFSPAKEGPLRVDPPDEAGRMIAQMLAEGLTEGERIVARATEGVAANAVISDATGSVTGGGGVTVLVDGTGLPRALEQWLRHAIRTQGGGSVQQTLGRGERAGR